MNKIKTILLAGLLSISSVGPVAAQDGAFAAENFSATLTFTTDYTFRGTTFSADEPAMQGSFDWGYGPWFAGAWGTSTINQNTYAPGGELEIDYYFGWADNIGGVDLAIFPVFYTFPGQHDRAAVADDPATTADESQDAARDDFTFELWTSIGYGFEGIPGTPYVNLEFDWSPEYFENGDSSFYWKPSIAFSLPNGFGFDVAYGYQDVGGAGKNDFFGDDYSHYEIGITKSIVGFDLDLRYHDNLDEDLIGAGFALESELVFSIARSF